VVEHQGRTPTHFGDDWWGNVADPLRMLASKISDFFAPAAEASKDADKYEICIELPGVKEEDISVSLDHGTLLVSGEKEIQRHEEGKTYFFSEISYGKFQRSFRLPGDADGEKVSAGFSNGVLKIDIAKKTQQPTRKEIPIHK